MQFEIDQDEEDSQIERGYFGDLPSGAQEAYEAFDAAWSGLENRELAYGGFLDACQSIVKKHPQFMDVYAHMALVHLPPHCYNEAELETAEKLYQKGFNIGKKLIPKNYSGCIEWSFLGNRPFLRNHHGLILCALRKGKVKRAINLMKQHLKWNPNDNMGVRFLLGDAFLLTGKFSEAREILEEGKNMHSSPLYSLGLLEFILSNYPLAITYFRQGIAKNPRIAEYLQGRRRRVNRVGTGPDEFFLEEEAEGYFYSVGHLLFDTGHALSIFLDWIFNSSKGLAERAAFATIREELATRPSSEIRLKLKAQEMKMYAEITVGSSVEMIAEANRLCGNKNLPWDWKRHLSASLPEKREPYRGPYLVK